MIDGSEIAAMFAELDGRDRLEEWLERARERTDHGYHAYTKHGCRCDVCRAANAEYMRVYNKLRRRRDPVFRAARSGYEANRRARKRAAQPAEVG